MLALVVDGVRLPPESLSVAYTRQLAGGGAEAARETPTAVELRLDVRGCATLDEAMRTRVLSHPELRADRHGVVRVNAEEFPSRAKNLHAARVRLAELVGQALSDRIPAAPLPAPSPPKRRGVGLTKRP